MSTISSFKSIWNKHDAYGEKAWMKNFCDYITEQVIKIINFFSWNHIKTQKSVIFVRKKFENKYVKDKKYCKVRDHCHYTGE